MKKLLLVALLLSPITVNAQVPDYTCGDYLKEQEAMIRQYHWNKAVLLGLSSLARNVNDSSIAQAVKNTLGGGMDKVASSIIEKCSNDGSRNFYLTVSDTVILSAAY